MSLASIVLFVYNRPWHTMQTVEALKNNKLANESELFIYSDGWKNENDKPKVIEVRKYLKTIIGFKKKYIIEMDKNKGLANSIIEGVTEIINEYGKIIVLEDDLVTSKYFLKFMNEALNTYEHEEKIMSITGYMFPLKTRVSYDAFFLSIASSWSWATWKRAWKYYKRNPREQIGILDKRQIKDFNLNNAYDFWGQLRLNYEGKIYTWAIFWYLTIFLKKGFTLFPKESLVRNIGFDGSGTHCGTGDTYNVLISIKDDFKFPKNIKEDNIVKKEIIDYFSKIKKPFYARVINRIKLNFSRLLGN